MAISVCGVSIWGLQNYRGRAIITRGLYTLNPLFEGQKRFFKKTLPLCMVSIQERVIMARVRYVDFCLKVNRFNGNFDIFVYE